MNWSDSITAPCKINLRLKVTGSRPDGYHTLDTWFLPLDFPCDTLTLAETETPGISLESPDHPELAGADNLIVRAAEKYAERAGTVPRWHFTLVKRIPVAAGLGGGSSDAAAALLLLNRRHQALAAAELEALALKLGADVPFFLHRRPARATGIGEKLELLPETSVFPAVLILFPGFPVSAKYAYCAMDPALAVPDDPEIPEKFASALRDPASVEWKFLAANDLAPALYRKFPLLELLKQQLISCGALAAEVSGSGSSLFALFAEAPEAEKAAQTLRGRFQDNHEMRIFTGKQER